MAQPAQQFSLAFAGELCFKCGIIWYMNAEWVRRLRQNRDTFYCPNGHPQHYLDKSDAEVAREELAREKAARERVEGRLRFEQDAHASTERQRRATKGQLTKVKKRVAHGVCPCCNRTFTNLADHMETKHPKWIEEK